MGFFRKSAFWASFALIHSLFGLYPQGCGTGISGTSNPARTDMGPGSVDFSRASEALHRAVPGLLQRARAPGSDPQRKPPEESARCKRQVRDPWNRAEFPPSAASFQWPVCNPCKWFEYNSWAQPSFQACWFADGWSILSQGCNEFAFDLQVACETTPVETA